MEKDDSVYLGHMLDRAQKVMGKVRGKTRAEFDADEDLHIVWMVATERLPKLAELLAPLVASPPDS
ncbi:MAG: hypothetical protein ACLQIB_45995 [Isosphaeraceae bacterium]